MLGEADGERRVAEVGLLVAAVGVATAVGVAACGPMVLRALLPPAFAGALALLPWLCVGQALKATGDTLNLGALLGRTTTAVTALGLGCGGLLIAGYAVLLPEGGLAAAAGMAVTAWAVRLGAMILLAQRLRPLPYAWGRLVLVLGTGGTSIALVTALDGHWGGLAAIPTGVAASVAILALAATPTQRQALRDGLAGLRRRHKAARTNTSGAA